MADFADLLLKELENSETTIRKEGSSDARSKLIELYSNAIDYLDNIWDVEAFRLIYLRYSLLLPDLSISRFNLSNLYCNPNTTASELLAIAYYFKFEFNLNKKAENVFRKIRTKFPAFNLAQYENMDKSTFFSKLGRCAYKLFPNDSIDQICSDPSSELDMNGKSAFITTTPEITTNTLCSETMKPEIQRIFINKAEFQIINLLGKGGFSNVYRVSTTVNNDYLQSNTLYAVKVIELLEVHSSTVENFMNEVKLMRETSCCSNVIKLLDYEVTKSNLYILMELADYDLSSYISSMFRKNIDESEDFNFPPYFIQFTWYQMLECVESIHTKNIVHLDLKPGNFVFVKGHMKVIDLGESQRIPSGYSRDDWAAAKGSLSYMAPEQLAIYVDADQTKFRVGPKTDVWSLGVILHLLVYKRPLFFEIQREKYASTVVDESKEIVLPPIRDQILVQSMQNALQRKYETRWSVSQLLELFKDRQL